MTMTKTEAQECVRAYLEDWFANIGPDFVQDSITGSDDSEAIEALELVGLDFNWDVKVSID